MDHEVKRISRRETLSAEQIEKERVRSPDPLDRFTVQDSDCITREEYYRARSASADVEYVDLRPRQPGDWD